MGFVSVLEEVVHPFVPAIEGTRVACQEGPHAPGERAVPRAHQEMRMVRLQRPGVHRPSRMLSQGGKPSHEVGSVPIIPENGGPLNPPHHDMVEGPRSIETGLTGHGGRQATTSRHRTQRPLYRQDHPV